MKSVLIVFFVTLSSLSAFGQDTDKMDGTYEGYIDGAYVFTDSDGYKAEFTSVTNDVSTKYDLTSQKYVGMQFMITFTVDTEIDEEDEEIQVSTIVELVMPE